MRLALYHPCVYLTSGVERPFVELLKRSRHDWVIYTHHYSPATTYPELGDADSGSCEMINAPPRWVGSLMNKLEKAKGFPSRFYSIFSPLPRHVLVTGSSGLGLGFQHHRRRLANLLPGRRKV